MFTEKSIIQLLQKFQSPTKHPELRLGIGDDAAVMFYQNTEIVVSTDSLIENNHFLLSLSTGTQVAQKLITKNMTDLYVKNATPLFILSNLHLNQQSLSQYPKFLPSFIQELEYQCIQNNIQLIGGDTAFSNINSFTITIIGKTNHFIPRKSNKVQNGDPIFLLGHTGMSKMILNELLSKKPLQLEQTQTFYYHAPKIQKNILKILKKYNATVSIDQSDSLLKSLNILAQQNNKTIHLFLKDVPIHPIIISILQKKGLLNHFETSLDYTLYGCEDFAIIFSCPQEQEKKSRNQHLYKIGVFSKQEENDVVSFYKKERYNLEQSKIRQKDFEHFNKNGR